MNEALFVLLVAIGTAAAQTPAPEQAWRIQLQKAARSAPIKIIGSPTLLPAQPVRIIPPLKKMESNER